MLRTLAKSDTQMSLISICASAITSKKQQQNGTPLSLLRVLSVFFAIGFGAKRLSRTIGERRSLQTTGWQWGCLWSIYLLKHLLKQEKVKHASKVPCGGCQIKRNVSKMVRGCRKDSINWCFNIMHDANDDILNGGSFLFMIIEKKNVVLSFHF